MSISDDPLWYKDAIIYELHVRAFHDSNNDGIGDLEGLIGKLDYLVDLGVTAIWLLPFYPSPLRDGGYDIADYTGVHEHYGTRRDFRKLLQEAHARGLRIITELVLNHTSAEHPWFQRARRAPKGSPAREMYVWSDTPRRYEGTRIIFQDFETSNWSWDPVANAYYWHRFYGHQPDLNFDNPAVHTALFEVIDFWLEMGVDGLRLDAVPYLYEREGTSCENLPETHEFLRKLRAHVDAKFKNRMLLAEANQWPADAAAYFGGGDECHMNFHFPLMPRMFMAVEQEDSFPIVNILKRTPRIPDTCQWATFLRNHDELTLEMVTDEDRDTMYRAYAAERHARVNLGIRRRLAPLLNVRRKVELMNALLLSLPGTPVLYYGDEIGMGDNIYLGDRDGVRTPMQWSGDRNGGFSRANPQKVYLPTIIDPEFHYEAINVEAQQSNPSSMLWWMKRLIAKRKEYRLFGRGETTFVAGDNPRVLAFVREHEGEQLLVLANLSRFVQCARLDLSKYESSTPVEVFGQTRFPRIESAPFFVSLGPHGFYWLSLVPPAPAVETVRRTLRCRGTAEQVLAAPHTELARVLLRFVTERRWFRGKARTVKKGTVTDVIKLGDGLAHVMFLIEYEHGAAELYSVPVAFALETGASPPPAAAVIANVEVADATDPTMATCVLIDAIFDDRLGALALSLMKEREVAHGERGQITGTALKSLKQLAPDTDLTVRPISAEQTNSSIIYGNRFVLKLFRVLADGPSSEDEIGRFLAARDHKGTARIAGALEYLPEGRERSTLGTLFDFVPNQGDAWRMTLDSLDRYFDRVLTDEKHSKPAPEVGLLGRLGETPDESLIGLIGPYIDQARLLGLRTAQLHEVLASKSNDPLFAPQPFDNMHLQSIYQSAAGMLSRTVEVLRGKQAKLPESTRELIEEVVAAEGTVDAALSRITHPQAGTTTAMRIRVHGDYHLGQVLWTGDDFVIIDFEGEPTRPLSQRRFKRCPLRDVSGMLRSFSYAAEAALRSGRLRAEDVAMLRPWARLWVEWVAATFLTGYLEKMKGTPLFPPEWPATKVLIEFYLLEKVIYEIGYELDHRPDWLEIPLRACLALVGASS